MRGRLVIWCVISVSVAALSNDNDHHTVIVPMPANFAGHQIRAQGGACPIQTQAEVETNAPDPVWRAIDFDRTIKNTLIVLSARNTANLDNTYTADMRRVVAFGFEPINVQQSITAASCTQVTATESDRIKVSPGTIVRKDNHYCRFYVLWNSKRRDYADDQINYFIYKSTSGQSAADRFDEITVPGDTITCTPPTVADTIPFPNGKSNEHRAYAFVNDPTHSHPVLISAYKTNANFIVFRATTFTPSDSGCSTTQLAGNPHSTDLVVGLIDTAGVTVPIQYKLRADSYGAKGIQVWLECTGTQGTKASTDCISVLYGAVTHTFHAGTYAQDTGIVFTISEFTNSKRWTPHAVKQTLLYPYDTTRSAVHPIYSGVSIFFPSNEVTDSNTDDTVRGLQLYQSSTPKACEWPYKQAVFPEAGVALECQQLILPDVVLNNNCVSTYRYRNPSATTASRDGRVKCYSAPVSTPTSPAVTLQPVAEIDLFMADRVLPPTPATPPPPGVTTTLITTTTTTVTTTTVTSQTTTTIVTVPATTHPPGNKPTTTEPQPPCAEACTYGHGCIDNACQPCQVGTYRSTPGSGPCLSCEQAKCPIGMVELQSCRDTEVGALATAPPICGRTGSGHCPNGTLVTTDLQSTDALWHWECIENTSYPCPPAPSAVASELTMFEPTNWYVTNGPGTALAATGASVPLRLLDQYGGLPEQNFLPIMVLRCWPKAHLISSTTTAPTVTTTVPAARAPSISTVGPGKHINYRHEWKVAQSAARHTWFIAGGFAVAIIIVWTVFVAKPVHSCSLAHKGFARLSQVENDDDHNVGFTSNGLQPLTTARTSNSVLIP